MTAVSGAGKFAQEVASSIPNSFNKMDVEDPFNISEALTHPASRTGRISPSNNILELFRDLIYIKIYNMKTYICANFRFIL